MATIPVELDSVFGPTHCGVPSPWVPAVTPYPTRFHGSVFRYPQQSGGSFVVRPFEVPVNLAVGQVNPDGIGGFVDEHPNAMIGILIAAGLVAAGLIFWK